MKYAYVPGSDAADERARRAQDSPPVPPGATWTVLRAAQPYDPATPGTPAGLLDLVRAAAEAEGGVWHAVVTLAVASSPDGEDVVASLALRLALDAPEDGRRRRAWVVYVRRGDRPWSATSTAAGGGAALLDTQAGAVPMRTLGVLELKAILLGRTYVPPPPRPGPPRLRCYTCDKVTPFSTSTWRPYARHRCETNQDGRS